MQKNQFSQQEQNNDHFLRPTVVNAHCKIRSQNYPDAGTNCNFAAHEKSKASGETCFCFRPSDTIKISHIKHRKILEIQTMLRKNKELVVLYMFLIFVIIKNFQTFNL